MEPFLIVSDTFVGIITFTLKDEYGHQTICPGNGLPLFYADISQDGVITIFGVKDNVSDKPRVLYAQEKAIANVMGFTTSRFSGISDPNSIINGFSTIIYSLETANGNPYTSTITDNPYEFMYI